MEKLYKIRRKSDKRFYASGPFQGKFVDEGGALWENIEHAQSEKGALERSSYKPGDLEIVTFELREVNSR